MRKTFFKPINDAEEMTAPKSLKFCIGIHHNHIFWVTIAIFDSRPQSQVIGGGWGVSLGVKKLEKIFFSFFEIFRWNMLNNSQNGWEKQFSVLGSVYKLNFCGFVVEWSRFLLASPSWKAALNYDFAVIIALTYHLRHHFCCLNKKNIGKDKKIFSFFFTPRGTPQPTP